MLTTNDKTSTGQDFLGTWHHRVLFSEQAVNVAILASLALIYFIAGKLGLRLAAVSSSATAVWAPTGIAFTLYLLWGYRVWPAVFIGAFFVNITTSGSFLPSLAIAVGNALEGAVGAYLVNRFAAGRHVFDRPQDVFKFAVLAGMLSTAVSATFGATSLCLGHIDSWKLFKPIWLTWWLGDMGGDLVVAPALIFWIQYPFLRWKRKELLELIGMMVLLILVGQFLWGGYSLIGIEHYPLGFISVPVLFWMAYRYGQREAVTGVLVVSVMATWGTLHGFGPFIHGSHNTNLLLLQIFMAVSSVLTLAFAAVVAAHHAAVGELQMAHDELDLRVQERTEELLKVNRALNTEILERKRVEQSLQSKTEELSRSNTELSLFGSVVSHELQEPLRKMLTFGDLLKGPGANKDKNVKEYIGKMQDAALRMQRLVEDMLALSRVTTNAQPLEAVSLGKVMKGVVADYEARLEMIKGSIEVGRLPVVTADESQMRQLFQNLVSNAFKFRKKDVPLRIEVSSHKTEDGFVEIHVSDNGIGFDEQYLDRIFKPFQRLHRRTEYEGSGMGLAICQRILLRHGGTITAKSVPGQGSVFIITLPAGEVSNK